MNNNLSIRVNNENEIEKKIEAIKNVVNKINKDIQTYLGQLQNNSEMRKKFLNNGLSKKYKISEEDLKTIIKKIGIKEDHKSNNKQELEGYYGDLNISDE